MSKKNKVCITGATAGIGKATAEVFARQGWNLILTGRRKDRLVALKEYLENEYSVQVRILCFDIQQKKTVQQAIESLDKADWEIDVLVNNAGLALGKEAIQDGNISDWEIMIDTNVKGLLYITKCFLPNMISRKKGHIINLSSVAAKEVYAGGNVYCATKHAVDALTKSMRLDLVHYGIKVSSIAPGMVDTEFSEVRFKGDKKKADLVYSGFTPLYAGNIADVIFYVADQPEHVCIQDVLIMPTAQANATTVHKKQ